MPSRRVTCAAAAAAPAAEDLSTLFLDQLAWIVGGAQASKRALTRWMHATPPPSFRLGEILSQARQLTARHLLQLEQLVGEMPLPAVSADPAIRALLQSGEPSASAAADSPEVARGLAATVQRLSTCFGTACASAAETAVVLGRVDIAAVMGSWAAAWRDLQRGLAAAEPAPSVP